MHTPSRTRLTRSASASMASTRANGQANQGGIRKRSTSRSSPAQETRSGPTTRSQSQFALDTLDILAPAESSPPGPRINRSDEASPGPLSISDRGDGSRPQRLIYEEDNDNGSRHHHPKGAPSFGARLQTEERGHDDSDIYGQESGRAMDVSSCLGEGNARLDSLQPNGVPGSQHDNSFPPQEQLIPPLPLSSQSHTAVVDSCDDILNIDDLHMDGFAPSPQVTLSNLEPVVTPGSVAILSADTSVSTPCSPSDFLVSSSPPRLDGDPTPPSMQITPMAPPLADLPVLECGEDRGSISGEGGWGGGLPNGLIITPVGTDGRTLPRPSVNLDSVLYPRGLMAVDSGGRGHCLFYSVIASLIQADFVQADSPLQDVLNRDQGCAALPQEIVKVFSEDPHNVNYRDILSDVAWLRYVRSIEHNGPGDERYMFAITEIFKCIVWVYSNDGGSGPLLHAPSTGMLLLNIFIGNLGNRHFVSVQPQASMTVPVVNVDDRPCMACVLTDDPENTLECDYCDSACHLRCTDPRILSIPPTHVFWICTKCVHHIKHPDQFNLNFDTRLTEYRQCLHQNALPDLVNMRGIYRQNTRSRPRSGVIIFPEWDDLIRWWPNCWKRDSWTKTDPPVAFVCRDLGK